MKKINEAYVRKTFSPEDAEWLISNVTKRGEGRGNGLVRGLLIDPVTQIVTRTEKPL